MAKCGIEKYDTLPARVDFIDVDLLRAILSTCLKEKKNLIDRLYLLQFKQLFETDESLKQRVICALKSAVYSYNTIKEEE